MPYDLTDPEFLRDPAPVLAQMRREGPFVKARIPLLGTMWLATSDATCRYVLKSTDLFVRDASAAGGKSLDQRLWWFPRFLKPILMNLTAVDGAQHKRLRGLVDKAFARTEIESMKPLLSSIADGLLDKVDPTRPIEIQSAYARPLPLMAICELLGIPQSDRDRIARWIAPISGTTNTLTIFIAMPGLFRLLNYFRRDFQAVRGTSRPGLISALVEAEIEGDQLSEDELLAMVFTLFVAGHETTVHLITNAIYGLITNPAAIAEMRDNPAGMPLLIEEFMRYSSPVTMTNPHFVTRDTAYEGITLAKGEMVTALLIGANHDPARFASPAEFRPQRRPNPHIGFGYGPHVCLGMQLARAEAQVALERLFTRYPQVRLANPDQPPKWSKRTGMHGLTGLQLRLGGG